MKKIISLLLITVTLLSLTACGGAADVSGQNSQGGNGGNVEPSSQSTADVQELQGEIAGEITVSAYETVRYKSFLDEAAAAFEAKYPGTKVNISTFSAMPEVKTSESGGKKMQIMTVEKDDGAEQDYINKINTELMSGAGADILAMDVIPYYKYAESGQLEDLNKYMEADANFSRSDYRENVLRAMEFIGGQYVFPLDYSFDYFAYDSTLFTEEEQKQFEAADAFSYEQLMEAGQVPFAAANAASPENPIQMFGANPETLFRSLLKANYRQFVDVESKTADFKSGAFAELLTTSKEYAEKGYIKEGVVGGKVQMTPDMFEKNQAQRYLYKTKSSMTLLQQFNKNSNIRMAYGGSTDSGNEENDEIAGFKTNANGENPFTYSQAYGINANSANKATAWEFIKFLAGEEMQTSLNLFGMPVNKSALSEKTKQAITGQLYQSENNSGSGELTQEQTEIYEEYMAEVEKLSGMINTFFVQDATISAAIDSEIRYFFDGAKTADEVAGVLQNKIELYLNE